MKELFPPELPPSLFQDITYSHPSLVYVSKSILRTVYHRTFVNKLLFSLGVLLLVVGAPLLVLSIIADTMSTGKKGKTDVSKFVEVFNFVLFCFSVVNVHTHTHTHTHRERTKFHSASNLPIVITAPTFSHNRLKCSLSILPKTCPSFLQSLSS